MSLEQEMLTLFQEMGEYKELLETSLILCADVYFDLEKKDKNIMTDSEKLFLISMMDMETTFDNNPNLLNPQNLQEKIQGLKISFEVYHALEQLWLELNEKEILTPNESDFIQKLSQFQDKLVSSFVHLNNSYETFKELLRKHDM